MRILFFVIALVMIFPAAAGAQDGDPLRIGLAEDRVAITTGFNGGRVTVFGVKNEPGEIAIVIRGPEKEMVVRHKSRVMGIWMNSDSVRFRNVPAYYDLAIGSSEKDLAPPDLRKKYGIGLGALDFRHIGREKLETAERFREALIRNKQSQGHFPLTPENLYFLNGDFFKASFYLPPDVPTGEYTIQAFLFRQGAMRAMQETKLRVAQEGFSARLFLFAYNQGFFYGLTAVLFAIIAGWSAWAFLKRE